MDKTYFTRKKPDIPHFEKSIFVNQAGYHPKRFKRAVIKTVCQSFFIKDLDGNVKFEGKTEYFGLDADSQDTLYLADFTQFTQIGRYYIETDSGERSLQFEISNSCTQKLFDDICKAFYYLRCGCELQEKHAGVYVHPICHETLACEWDNRDVRIDVSGGWHDAGDYGRYITAGACALAHILYAFEMFPKSFENQNLNIPESDCEMPDILCECKYELDWFLKMQKSDGGVYHKASTAMHAPFIMPQNDREPLYLFAVSSMATADFAAICAHASKIYRKYDSAYADKLFEAAQKSYTWLEENPDFLGFENPKGCNTGNYGEWNDRDNRFWASVEMFAASGNEKYHDDMKEMLKNDFPFVALGYGCVSGFGALSYIFCDKKTDKSLCERFKSEFVAHAEKLKNLADNCGYGVAMQTQDYCWGSNMNVLKRAMIFIIADKIENSRRFSSYAYAQLDYIMGVNATGYSYVTQNGEFCANYPHLRPAHADGIEKCIPGMVCGGANRFPADPDAKLLVLPGTPPMKCYCDDVGCYSLNEITIYWNSPAVFLCAYIQSDNQD